MKEGEWENRFNEETEKERIKQVVTEFKCKWGKSQIITIRERERENERWWTKTKNSYKVKEIKR